MKRQQRRDGVIAAAARVAPRTVAARVARRTAAARVAPRVAALLLAAAVLGGWVAAGSTATGSTAVGSTAVVANGPAAAAFGAASAAPERQAAASSGAASIATERSAALSAGRAAIPPRVLVFGDSRPWSTRLDALVNPIFTRVTTAMLRRKGGLAIGVGDYVYAKYWYGGTPNGPDSRAVLDRRYRAFKRNEGRLAARMPVLLAIGNHEGVDETLVDSATPFPGTVAWQAAFKLPSAPGAGERYFSYDWRGKVHVVVLFSRKSGLGFAGPGWPGNSAQARWLIGDLRRDRHPWTIVALHHPIYDPRYGHAWFSDHGERDRLASFLRRQGVDLVLQGHDHFYRRHVQRGVPYVTQGGAGAELYPAILGDADDAVRYSEWGFSEIELREGYRRATLRAWIVEDDGSMRLGDQVELKRNPRR